MENPVGAATLLETVEKYSQVLANVSQFVLIILTIIGLFLTRKQILLLVRDIRVRNKREASAMSFAAAKEFAEKFIPKVQSISSVKPGKPFALLNRNNRRRIFRFSEFTPEERNHVKNKVKKILEEKDNAYLESISSLMNELDYFSIQFTKDIADRSIVYESIAKVFCSIVEDFYYLYCAQRNSDTRDCFSNTISLYNTWKDQIEGDRLNHSKKLALGLIREIDAAIDHSTLPNEQTPLGTE